MPPHRRRPIPTHYLSCPIREIGDRRLREICSPRHRHSPEMRTALMAEMGFRFVRGLVTADVLHREVGRTR